MPYYHVFTIDSALMICATLLFEAVCFSFLFSPFFCLYHYAMVTISIETSLLHSIPLARKKGKSKREIFLFFLPSFIFNIYVIMIQDKPIVWTSDNVRKWLITNGWGPLVPVFYGNNLFCRL